MKLARWIQFGVLCCWAGSAWLYDLFAPGVLTGLPRTALHNGLVALGCFDWARRRREPVIAGRVALKIAAAALLLFALPELLLAGASAHVSQSTEALVFLLVPAVVVFWFGQQSAGFGVGQGSMAGLVPALTGLGGAALLLPFELPSSLIGRLWLGALVISAVAAGVAAISMHRLLAGVSMSRAGSIVFGTTCLVSAGCSSLNWAGLAPLTMAAVSFECLRLLLVDTPILLLGLYLLRTMQPIAFSARLLLVPALTLLEGIVAERPEVGWYGWLGLVLMLGAATTVVVQGQSVALGAGEV